MYTSTSRVRSAKKEHNHNIIITSRELYKKLKRQVKHNAKLEKEVGGHHVSCNCKKR